MKPSLFTLLAGFALGTALPTSGSSLLTDNVARTGSASYPGTTSATPSAERIATAATYVFEAEESAGSGLGNTDPHILELPKSLERLLDGYNERVGNTALFGGWQSEQGVTAVFDLNDVYEVDRVSASVREDASRGAATFQAFGSVDGTTYAPLGEWDGNKTALDAGEADSGRNTELTIAPAAPVKARYVKVYLSHWNEDHSARKYNQLVVGEIAIWGEKK